MNGTPETWIGLVIALVLGGGLKAIADIWMANKKANHVDAAEASGQIFNHSLTMVNKLESRVEIVEAAVAKCRDEHTQCERRAGMLEGQLSELRRFVENRVKNVDEQLAHLSDAKIKAVNPDVLAQ